MNIKNLLKASTLTCIIMLYISNNTNNATEYKVNTEIFQHKVSIYNGEISYLYQVPFKKLYKKDSNTGYLVESDFIFSQAKNLYMAYQDDPDEYNYPEYNCHVINFNNKCIDNSDNVEDKFNKLYELKISNGIVEDTKTSLSKEVSNIFGNDYKVLPRYSTYEFLKQFPEKRIIQTKVNGSKKEFIASHKIPLVSRSLMQDNGLELYKVIQLDGIFNKNKKNQFNIVELLLNKLDTPVLWLTNGNNSICYDCYKCEIQVHHKPGTSISSCEDINEIINKFKKLFLLLKEKYEVEDKVVKEVFGQDFNLYYCS